MHEQTILTELLKQLIALENERSEIRTQILEAIAKIRAELKPQKKE